MVGLYCESASVVNHPSSLGSLNCGCTLLVWSIDLFQTAVVDDAVVDDDEVSDNDDPG